MNADENGIFGRVRDPGAQFQRDKDITVAGHFDLEAFRLEKRLDVARYIEREVLFAAIAADRALIVAAVTRIEHDGFEPAEIRDHLRAQLRFEGFGEVNT